MKKISLYFIAAIILTGCFKFSSSDVNRTCTSGCMVFNVKVSTGATATTLNGLSNSPVQLIWDGASSVGLFGSPAHKISNGYTDGNGNIQFKFSAQADELKSGGFHVRAKAVDGNYFDAEREYFDVIKFDTVLVSNLYMPSKATLKIVFKNFNTTTTTDYFSIRPFFVNYGYGTIGPSMTDIATGSGDTYFTGQQPAFLQQTVTGTTAGNSLLT